MAAPTHLNTLLAAAQCGLPGPAKTRCLYVRGVSASCELLPMARGIFTRALPGTHINLHLPSVSTVPHRPMPIVLRRALYRHGTRSAISYTFSELCSEIG